MKNLILNPANIRLITLMISRMFLKTPTVSSVLIDARKGLILYFMSAMLAVASLLVIYFEIYTFLVFSGVNPIAAIAIVFLLLVLSAALLREYAHKYFKQAKEIKDHSKVLAKAKSWDKQAEAIVRSFLNGLFEESR